MKKKKEKEMASNQQELDSVWCYVWELNNTDPLNAIPANEPLNQLFAIEGRGMQAGYKIQQWIFLPSSPAFLLSLLFLNRYYPTISGTIPLLYMLTFKLNKHRFFSALPYKKKTKLVSCTDRTTTRRNTVRHP